MISNGDGLRRWRVAGAASAIVLAAVVTLGTTSAAFTATTPVTGLIESGRVELSAGGVSSLTFGGADLAAIGPGTNLTESITVTNSSTVTLPTEFTEIALWADTSGAPSDPGGLSAALTVQITRSIGEAQPKQSTQEALPVLQLATHSHALSAQRGAPETEAISLAVIRVRRSIQSL